jgi:hypothetical protein
MLLITSKETQVLFFEDSCDLLDILFLTTQLRNITLNQASIQLPTNNSNIMSPPQMIFVENHSMFAEAVQFLTSFNPEFHLDDSYLDVHHPKYVPGLFHRRKGQLPIISENSPLKMDPLNWEYMYRPNRPFNFISNKHLRRTIPKIPPRPWVEREKQKQKAASSSSYLEEQAAFFNAIPPSLPVDEAPIADEDLHPAGPLKVWVLFVWAIMVTLGWVFVFLPLMIALGALKWVAGKLIERCENVGGIPWETIGFALVAWKLVGWLPGMEGKVEVVEEAWKAESPLYVMVLRNPNQIRKFNCS